MMRMRGDMTCFHEPFGEAWYQGDEARWPRLKAGSPRTKGLTFESVLRNLKSSAIERPVFSKDMPQFIDHLWRDDFLANFQHSFLIRDPAKVLTSVYRNWPDFDPNEIGFPQLRELFDRLSDERGEARPVIDSNDLAGSARQSPFKIRYAWPPGTHAAGSAVRRVPWNRHCGCRLRAA